MLCDVTTSNHFFFIGIPHGPKKIHSGYKVYLIPNKKVTKFYGYYLSFLNLGNAYNFVYNFEIALLCLKYKYL